VSPILNLRKYSISRSIDFSESGVINRVPEHSGAEYTVGGFFGSIPGGSGLILGPFSGATDIVVVSGGMVLGL
jgi:hypothetical protein